MTSASPIPCSWHWGTSTVTATWVSAVASGVNQYTVIILLGNGDGSFQAGPSSSTGFNSPACIAVGDFNGDGHLDLAVANYGDENGDGAGLSILLGNGDGTFQDAHNYAMGPRPCLCGRGRLQW